MGTWVSFGMGLLINHMVNVAETFTDILKQYFLQMNFVKFAKQESILGECVPPIFSTFWMQTPPRGRPLPWTWMQTPLPEADSLGGW